MAYDRYDTRDDQPRWRDRDDGPRSPGRGDNRGFFERAGDEIASWFGDDRDRDHHRSSRDDRPWRGRDEHGWDRDRERSQHRDHDRGYGRDAQRDRSDREESYRGTAWPSSERDYDPSWRNELRGGQDAGERNRDRGGYRPMTGDYGRSERAPGTAAAGGFAAGEWDRNRGSGNRSEWASDPYRSSSRAGSRDQSDRSQDFDPHYRSWRDQHMSSLDRDYDDYRRENQSKFDNDFSSWRDRRTHKRGLLGQIREHMEVVGSDDQHVGKVDKTAGDRIILAKSDPDSGGVHHSLSCAHIDRVEGDRVILDRSADQARKEWRDESRSRALFEREDSGEMGSHTLNRSFEGTYR
ncbi:DUF2171 domain-containing protein [Sphingomonas sp.]|uniref:DUF2171 domain-containing protein n=1 Tax=Sphingomonas sp. TaxID=28214 RepID=UPI0025F704B0|nr:DUF2171 domain-containing protein [Sphingomonas sp.]MBV9528321.1 DUF2171 domain-containing protein [Sphingomonas sp.]